MTAYSTVFWIERVFLAYTYRENRLSITFNTHFVLVYQIILLQFPQQDLATGKKGYP